MKTSRFPRGMFVVFNAMLLIWLVGSLTSDQATTGTTVGGFVGIILAAVLMIGAYVLARRR